jgi:hypothetical protein
MGHRMIKKRWWLLLLGGFFFASNYLFVLILGWVLQVLLASVNYFVIRNKHKF